MKLQTVVPPDRGSLSVVYSCPECGYEMAMLTNAYETQVVQSLGVRIGPGDRRQRRRVRWQCPFTAMIPGNGEVKRRGRADPRPVDRRGGSQAREHSRVRPPHGEDRHREIRAERGALEVDEKILDAAKDFFGM